MSKWKDISTAPKDGTPILLQVGFDWPFVGYWGYAGRFTSSVMGWMGHELGYHTDNDIEGWMRLPEPPEATK